MKLLSLNPTDHSSTICYFDGDILHYFKTERFEQVKHHTVLSKSSYEEYLKSTFNVTLKDIDEICFVLFSEKNKHPLPIEWHDTKNSSLVDHHHAHSLSLKLLCDTPSDVSIIIDGRGGDNSWVVYKNDIVIDRGDFKENVSIGHGMEHMGRTLKITGMKLDVAGKLMGLQSYGKIDYNFLEILKQYNEYNLGNYFEDEKGKAIPLNVIKGLFSFHEFQEYKNYNDDEINKSMLDWAATVHHRCGEIILNLFKKHANPDDIIHYSGGVAQNVIWNTLLKKHFKNLVIPPHSGDEGISLGGMEFLRQKHNLPKMQLENFPYSQTDEAPKMIIEEDTIKKAATFLSEGKIVAWYQGHGEVGPRALGNRSILMDPRIRGGRDIINKIKNREYYRPFGASVLSEFKKEYFDLDFENPYMLYVGVTQKPNLESITHVDGTCRAQTVSEPGHFKSLLEEFYKITGCPVLLNTSLNISGKPIAGHIQNAIDEFNNSDIDVLVVGNQIYQKTN